MLQFSVLGSGSAGNSAVVCSGTTRLLIDAGLSARQLQRRLEAVGIDPDELDGIVLTHEHGDHCRGLDVFLRKRRVPIYCNVRTREVLMRNLRSEVDWRLFESGDAFETGDIRVQSFYVPHDAVEPMGFVFRNGYGSVGVLSDVGHVTTLVRDHLQGVHTLYVESNYDEVMLQNDTKRPWSTKQRISSRHGHLSNDQAADLTASVASEDLFRVVLGHLSQDCNCPDVASEAIRKELRSRGFREVEVCCASQNEVLPLQPVARPRPERPAEPAPVQEPAPAMVAAVSAGTGQQLSLFDF